MMEKTRKWFYALRSVIMISLLAVCLTGCGEAANTNTANEGSYGTVTKGTDLKVHFINAGQGDSTLIESAGYYMLVDAGERDQGETVINYLKSQGVTKLDYVIGTHPHSDHIGGLEAVIKAFPADTIIMPNKEHTTKTYENLLDTIIEKDLKLTLPKPGDQYTIGNAAFTIIAPNRDYENNLNNWSVGIRLSYGDRSFILCGDAEKEAEADICANGLTISGDVLKVSHHGSSTSSSEQFMDQVNPQYAVISCGRNNDYGHPHKEVMELLNARGVKVYRTDQLGTIVAVTDGTSLTFMDSKGAVKEYGDTIKADESQEAALQVYILNTNTKKFHKPDCQSVKTMKETNKEEYSGSREELIQSGYTPCQSCKP